MHIINFISLRLKMSFRAYCVSIGFTCCHCLSAESTYAEANALLIDCLVIFCLSLNRCSHPLKHLNHSSSFMAISSAYIFNFWPSTAVFYFLTWQSSQTAYFVHCFALPVNPHEFLNITPFQSLLFNTILDF